MLDERRIERYRAMSAEERWREVQELNAVAWAALLELTPEERERRLAVIREEHEESDRAMLQHLRRLG